MWDISVLCNLNLASTETCRLGVFIKHAGPGWRAVTISCVSVSVSPGHAELFPWPLRCTARPHWMFRGKKWLIARFQLGKCLQFFVSHKVKSVLDAYWSMGQDKGHWLADWGPPLWFWNSNIFWKLEKTPDIIDDYFNAIPWSFIFLSPLPWTSKKLAFTVLRDLSTER